MNFIGFLAPCLYFSFPMNPSSPHFPPVQKREKGLLLKNEVSSCILDPVLEAKPHPWFVSYFFVSYMLPLSINYFLSALTECFLSSASKCSGKPWPDSCFQKAFKLQEWAKSAIAGQHAKMWPCTGTTRAHGRGFWKCSSSQCHAFFISFTDYLLKKSSFHSPRQYFISHWSLRRSLPHWNPLTVCSSAFTPLDFLTSSLLQTRST